ncbi:MAG: hypothetical protein COA91_01775 [Robiginitomaculum sp.]|nr:MAG: hypothetical protein COA91_01775 [Robiginitomaculum sp.]
MTKKTKFDPNIIYGLFGTVGLSLFYQWLSIPLIDDWLIYTLQYTPDVNSAIQAALTTNTSSVFLPLDFGGGRYVWATTTFIPIYGLFEFMSPTVLFLCLSSLMVATLYLSGYFITASVRFATTLGFIAALSTFNTYVFVYGTLMTLYLLVIYICIVTICLISYFRASIHSKRWFVAFCLSALLIIFGGEFWLNLAIPFLIASGFIFFWARKHNNLLMSQRILRVSIFIISALFVYMTIRLQFTSSYKQAGFESEMVYTNTSLLLMFEDMAVNYFTYLHMTLSSLFPGFLTFSPSYVALGPETILAEQHGYHADASQYIISSHLSSWRFVAGALALGFFALGWRWIKVAWNSTNPETLVPVVLFAVVALGFLIYIPVKMRPITFTAMLAYKATISTVGLMVLVAWLIKISDQWKISPLFRNIVIVLTFTSVTIAAFTRPVTQSSGLEAVGLAGVSNPLKNVRHKLTGQK